MTAVAPEILSQAWLAGFLQSSGFAGLLAVVAALIAYFTARHSTKTNAEATRAARERDRWWEMYVWLVDELETLEDERATMMVDALYHDAKTWFERAVLRAVASRLIRGGSRRKR